MLVEIATQECAQRWKQSTKEMEDMDSFNPENMEVALKRVNKYIKCMESHGNMWVGLNLHYPIIWLPTSKYQREYKMVAQKEVVC